MSTPIPPGTTLGRYEIQELLGAGGMGEVYLALDTELHRPVALKFLPADIAADSRRMQRFEQEARAASALNHPNIITLYEIRHEDGRRFFAAEFVEGVTLRQHMSARRMKLGDVLDISIQIASALVAAHAKGIVHRDIKPENVMIRPDGYVKILDFGLAKPTERGTGGVDTQAATRALVNTDPGAVMGTVSYMSPEQAAGKDVDARTDIWSLGVVLYEVVTGHAPFGGATPSHTIVSILEKEPLALGHYAPGVPEALEWIVTEALTKDREERTQTARELLKKLQRLKQKVDAEAEVERSVAPHVLASTGSGASAGGVSAGSQSTVSSHERPTAPTGESGPGVTNLSSAEYIVTGIRRHKRAVFIALAALAAGVGFALYKYTGGEKSVAPVFQNFTVSRITTSGRAQEANISPDGKYVVYLEMAEDGNRSLWVKQTATGNTIPIVPPTKGNILKHTSFSPDGNFVYYTFSDRTKRSALYQVSSVGGTPKKLVDVCDSPAAVSPDGRRLAFMRWEGHSKSAIVVVNVDGTGERVVTTLDGGEWFSDTGPAWSPDGKTIAAAAGVTVEGVEGWRLLGVDAQSGATRELSPKRWVDAGRVVWMPDGDALALIATERTDEWSAQVWRISYPSGEAARVTNDVQGRDDTSLGVTADGRTLITVTVQRLSRIETIPAGGDTSRPTRLTAAEANQEGFYGFALAPDGRIFFSSIEGGQSDLWVMNADGSGRRRLTSDTFFDGHPLVSPDGRYVVFRSNRPHGDTVVRLWRMDSDGGNHVQLAARADYRLDISPDGRWVLYDYWSASEKLNSLWKVSIDGGEPVRVTDYPASQASYSPDGQWVGCYFLDEQVTPNKWRYGVIPASGGRPVRQFDFTGFLYQYVQWTPDGRHLSYIGPPPDPSNIWLQPAAGGEARKLTDFKSQYIYRHAWSRDGKTLALARGVVTTDVVLLRDEK